MIILLGWAGAFFLTFALASLIRKPIVAVPPSMPRVSAEAPKSIPQLKSNKQERLVYPYSVIPGGVRSREELSYHIGKDPVVAAHYAEFNASDARIFKSEEPQFAHVSYRLRNKVYWTAKPVRIPKGEALITDGKEAARTRCGNKISVLPQDPVSEEEPPPEIFEVPIIASAEPPAMDLERLPEGELAYEPDLPLTPIIPIQPPQILPYYYRPLFVVNPPGLEVPEPGTFGFIAAGLMLILGLRFARKK
ncbi:MAG: hypothetical protein JXA73_18780 [Acidobacteria bacterium]|nr:hypothetical protein [Acidobacteriota bacterium]